MVLLDTIRVIMIFSSPCITSAVVISLNELLISFEVLSFFKLLLTKLWILHYPVCWWELSCRLNSRNRSILWSCLRSRNWNENRTITNSSVFSLRCQTSLRRWGFSFYRAMHFSAKRGLAIACRPSVCLSIRLSVTLVDCDHIAWKSWKLIARAISPTHSLFVAIRRSTYSQGNMGKFVGK